MAVLLHVIADYDKDNLLLRWSAYNDAEYLHPVFTFNIIGIIKHNSNLLDNQMYRLWSMFLHRKIGGMHMLNDQVLNLAYSTKFIIILDGVKIQIM